MVAAVPPSFSIITCPNGHDVGVPTEPGFQVMNGAGVEMRSVRDLDQYCPTCGPFVRRPDGTVEIRVNAQNPVHLRPIAWAVDQLLAGFRNAVPAESDRISMADNGRLVATLEALREHWEARGVDYDAVIASVIDATELARIS
jgi:hypothetical protein